MIFKSLLAAGRAQRCLAGSLLSAAASAAMAQGTGTATALGTGLSNEPSPYYIGASQALTHDSNASRTPFGASDNYSSTSLLGGFDQPFSRQRIYGTASVTLNRYQDETQLNNTSYALVAGIDWATIWRLSGNLSTTLDQSLVAPSATVSSPDTTRNLQRRKGISGLARWGDDSIFSLEARAGYSSQDVGGQSLSSNSSNESASLGAFYQPGTLLRLGLALRADRTRAPNAVQLDDGSFQADSTRGRYVDFLVDYNNGNALSSKARISYAKQTHESVNSADFSGLTGSVSVAYRATARTSFTLSAARDAGFNSTNGIYTPLVITQSPTGQTTTPTTVTLYENNQVTNSANAGVSYAATSKVALSAGVHYSRSTFAASIASGATSLDGADKLRGASLAASYAYSRALSFACNLSRDRREVSGPNAYGYSDDIASCSAQFLWR